MPFGMPGRKTAPKGIMKAQVFYPTMEEFSDFQGYIRKIETEHNAHLAGICKIVPPKEWIPRKAGYDLEGLNFEIEGPIKQKFNQIGSRGSYQTKGLIQPKMSVIEYHKMATSSKYATPHHTDYDDLERKYWKSLSFCPPIYGCDVANAISDPDLEIWNIAKLDSILKYVSDDLKTVIQGVNSPYLYFGMWKATFSWHVEDMDLYAINMVHYGAPKTWYCVPPKYGHLLEKACRQLFPNVASWCSNFMRHKTCLIAPHVLDKYGVPYQKITQEAREIIITFPYGYHSGFNHGFNIAESTNFATERWIEYGKRQRPCDCDRARVKFSMDFFVEKFQPDKYEAWLKQEDIAPHPEDPPDVAKEIMLRAENPSEYARQLEEKIRKIEEKRLKKIEQQKQRSSDNKKFPTVEEETFTLVDVYSHIDLNQIEVEIFPKSLKIHRGKQALEDHLMRSDYDIKDLIEKGVLYKIAERKINRQKRKAASSEQNYIIEKRRVTLYKHVAVEGINITVDPITKELVSEPSDKLIQFLQVNNLPVKELIDIGVFVKICDANLEIKKVEKIEAAEQGEPAAKKLKVEPSADVKDTNSAKPVHEIYRHRDTGNHFTVTKANKKIVGRKTELVQKLIGDRSIESLVDEGILVLVASKHTREAPREAESAIKRGVFTMNGNDVRVEVASNGSRGIYSFAMETQVLIKLVKAKPSNIATYLTWTGNEDECQLPMPAVHAMLSPDFTIKPCELHNAPSAADEPCSYCNVGSRLLNLNSVCQSLSESSATTKTVPDLKCGFDLSSQYIYLQDELQKKCHLIKFEEIPSNLFLSDSAQTVADAKMIPSAKEDVDESAEYFEDEDDDNFTTDESSESNDESSDDPDYYGSGSVKEWKSSHGMMSKKLKKKALRLEREERRRNRKSRGSRDMRRLTRITDEAKALQELTKRMVALPYEKGYQFPLDELIKTLGDDRGRVLAVMRIFRGFQIVDKVSGEDQTHYEWRGKDDETIKQVLWSMLESQEADSTDILWYICCEIMRTLMASRKDIRVFLPLIAQQFAVDESRRITITAAALEGMGLIEKLPDELGGFVYKGPFIYQEYTQKVHDKYAPEHGLKQLKLALEPVKFEEHHLYEIQPPKFEQPKEKMPDDIDFSQVHDEQMRRSLMNKDRVCKCGSSKPFKGGIKIEREGHKTHIRKSVFVGGLRKKRCKKCVPCLAPRCEKCVFCLNPQMKKPCQSKICQFPIVPNCPCFS